MTKVYIHDKNVGHIVGNILCTDLDRSSNIIIKTIVITRILSASEIMQKLEQISFIVWLIFFLMKLAIVYFQQVLFALKCLSKELPQDRK